MGHSYNQLKSTGIFDVDKGAIFQSMKEEAVFYRYRFILDRDLKNEDEDYVCKEYSSELTSMSEYSFSKFMKCRIISKQLIYK